MDALIMELVLMLQDYVRIDTSHPEPAYDQAVAFWEKKATADGFEVHRIQLQSGKPVVVIVQRGINPVLPALALAHHMDVVSVCDEEQWKYHPFSGQCDGDMIYGRGIQDMKAVGIVHYGALLGLKRRGVVLHRTVCLLLLPDEEIGGFTGAGMLVQTPEFKALNIGYVLDEGLASGDETSLLIKVSERKPLQMRITACGDAAHGSRLMARNATHLLISVLNEFVDRQRQQQQLGNQHPGQVMSINITSLSAGSDKAINVISSYASSTIDIRVPPLMSMADARVMVSAMVTTLPDLSVEIIAQADEVDFQSYEAMPLYQALEHAIEKCGLVGRPYFAEEASDLRFYLQERIVGLGLTPFTIAPNIHGIDEAVRISDIEIGLRVMMTFIEQFCKGV